MKRTLSLVLIMAVFFIVLCSCSNNTDLAGVYLMVSNDSAIVLFDDGTGQMYGYDATWKVNSDILTISRKTEPDTYYFDIFIDNKLSEIEKRLVEAKCNTVDNVVSSSFSEDGDKVRVKIANKDKIEETQKELSSIIGVQKVELFITEGEVYEYEFRIIDNCLVADRGAIYIKQGS